MKLVPLFTMIARVDAPLEIGKIAAGTRRIYNAVGGEFKGKRLNGKVLPGGGEWFLQHDGPFGEIDVRLMFETDDGALIYMRYSGVMEFNEKIVAAISEGRPSEFGDNQFLTQVRFESGDERYAWLTTTIAVGQGRIHPDCVEYDIYEVAHG